MNAVAEIVKSLPVAVRFATIVVAIVAAFAVACLIFVGIYAALDKNRTVTFFRVVTISGGDEERIAKCKSASETAIQMMPALRDASSAFQQNVQSELDRREKYERDFRTMLVTQLADPADNRTKQFERQMVIFSEEIRLAQSSFQNQYADMSAKLDAFLNFCQTAK